MSGLLLFDDRRELSERIRRAIDRCLEKLGVQPAMCYLNEADLPGGPVMVDGLCVVAAANVPPGHIRAEISGPINTARRYWE